ncbi:NUDIX domain-containing protein [Sphingomonas colocasiae]|nr:NUDIX domain-containing protein [Sphingomonas colocasiae]
MIERAARMAFAAGALVFPGGRIDAEDHALAAAGDRTTGGGGDPDERAARIAAIRETVEETGVTVGFDTIPDASIIAEWRQSLKAGKPFADLLQAEGITIDLDALEPFARWCPNLGEYRRFDTRFYIARLRHKPEIVTDADEAASHHWITAAEAIDAASAGSLQIIFPTLRNLERLARCDRYVAAVAHARSTRSQIISPEIRDADGDRWLCIPQDAGYPVTRVRLSEVTGP